MLHIDRDSKRGGERFAIPTLGEVQRKLAVLDAVAVTRLKQVIASNSAFAAARLKREVLRAVEQGCEPSCLAAKDELAAMDYAQQIFDAAKKQVADDLAKAASGKAANG